MGRIVLTFDPFNEWDETIEYPDDCRRIQEAFAKEGYEVTELQACRLWEKFSESKFAGWLSLPDSGIFADLLTIGWTECRCRD
tara:strand:+ start:566 stop:814 length:249 start_codon:yes stop_codon:yes gene_type:complete